MKLDELKDGASVFIDANIFIYNFGGQSKGCKELLLRCARGQLNGYTSVTTIVEVIHRLMIAEAITHDFVKPANAVRKLRDNPSIVKSLREYNKSIGTILRMNLRILELSTDLIEQSIKIRQETGLLVNDSLTISLMQASRLSNLASNDKDFARVKWINLYTPSDL